MSELDRYIADMDEDYFCPCADCLTWAIGQMFKDS